MRLKALSLVLLASLVTPSAGMGATRTIQEDDFQRLVSVSSPVISPDGKRALVAVSRTQWNEDRHDSEIVMIDIATRAQRQLTYKRKGVSDPSFAPNGSSVAFIAEAGSGDDAKPQVFVMPLDGGDARQVTHAKSGVNQYAWRPDSRAIAFTSDDSPPDRKGADRYRDSFIFTTQPIVDRDPPESTHLFVVAATGGASQQLTYGTQTIVSGEAQSTLAWSPDGKSIAMTVAANPILNDESYSRIAVVDVASHAMTYLTSHTAWESDARWSPDGAHIAYIDAAGDPQVNVTQLYVTAPGGGDGASVSASVDRAIASAAWLPDSRGLYFTVPDRTTVALFQAGLTANPQRVDLGGLVPQSDLDGAVGPGGALLFVASSAKVPAELYYRSSSGSIVKLTDYNAAIAALTLTGSQRITYATSTGIDGDAVLYLPPDFQNGKRYPLVVYIHGGPTSSSTQSFDFYSQVMAARGWMVLRPNYRGSNNLGIAYQRAVLYDPEEGPGKDIMAAVDAVRARGIVDDRNLAVCGWSYGGIMTAWMITAYHVWAAAVSGASVDDWITDYGTADDSLADMDLFHGSPFVAGNEEEWHRASAIWYAAQVTTPVLILSDVGDNRDSFATSSMYWRALRDNHKDATLRVWPVNGHFPSDPVRTADVYHYWIEYIAQHFRT